MIIATMYENEELLEWAIEYLEKDHFLECRSEYEALLADQKGDGKLQALLCSPNARVANEDEFKKQVLLKVCKEDENKIQKIISSNELDYDTKLRAITQLQQKIQQIKKEL